MKRVVTAKEMKMIDNYTIQNIGIPSLVLMERAAWSMVQRMLEVIDTSEVILAVCGAGNNGGDAIAVARILYGMGYSTGIYMAGAPEKWTDETKIQIQIARNVGVPEYNELDLSSVQLVVDGLFGIGLQSFVREPFAHMIDLINHWKNNKPDAYVWSVDIPSGVSADTGQVLGSAVKADYTVTFGYVKCGMILYPGRDYSGEIYIEDIGFPQNVLDKCSVQGFSIENKDLLWMPKRKNDSNKGDYGKILIIAGSKNMSGAAYFAAKAAYIMGAGLVRILTEEANRVILQTQLPQAMISVWEEMTNEQLKDIIGWADSVVIGPGIGIREEMKNRIEQVLSMIQCPLLLDADGLNLLAKENVWYDKLSKHTVVTPHMAEMSRLTGKYISDLKMDRSKAALEYAKERDFICVLKDSSTVISDGSQICFNRTGNHGMATGGSGDVLSGVIGALLGMGMDAFFAACLGVYIHGAAGDVVAEIYGKRSMTSVELIEGLINILK